MIKSPIAAEVPIDFFSEKRYEIKRGTIKKESEFDKKLDDFEYKLTEEDKKVEKEHETGRRRRFFRGRRKR